MREDIRNKFSSYSKEDLLLILNKIADIVDYAEDPSAINDIQVLLGQEAH